MMVLVMVFLILNTPRIILGMIEVSRLENVELCYETGQEYNVSKEDYISDIFARFLVILNSSLNFLIYCFVSSDFRNRLYSMVHITRSYQPPHSHR